MDIFIYFLGDPKSLRLRPTTQVGQPAKGRSETSGCHPRNVRRFIRDNDSDRLSRTT